jgi:hypothetical protein
MERVDDALAALAERRGAWLGDDLTAITLIASLIDQAERFLPEPVTSALLTGPVGRPGFLVPAGYGPSALSGPAGRWQP